MAEAITPGPRKRRRRWTLAEKRQIVEQTLRAGASVASIARERGVSRNSIRQWQLLYRTGKIDGRGRSTPAVSAAPAVAAFVPVKMVRPVRRSSIALNDHSQISGGTVVQVVLATGATLRIETVAMDATLMCALLAELRR